MGNTEILFGKRREDPSFSYDSGSVRARASQGERLLPKLNAAIEQAEAELKVLRDQKLMWEQAVMQCTHLETLRTLCNGEQDYTSEEGAHLLFET